MFSLNIIRTVVVDMDSKSLEQTISLNLKIN
jgi:hypothetical protein